MTISIIPLAVADLAPRLSEIELVYRLAFEDDEATGARFRQRLAREAASCQGFRFHAAFDDGTLVGFIYGYHLQRSNWWPQMILPALTAAGQDHWLDDCFELVEFAVTPSQQAHGIGGRLYEALFAEVSEPRALLGTDPPPTAAHALYTRRGWVTILHDWHLTPDDPAAHIVMALDRSVPQPASEDMPQ